MMTEEKQKLQFIFNHFGEDVQMKKLAEECAEYLEKYLKGDMHGARSEIADLKVLSDQFYLEEVSIRQEYDIKIKRTIERIKDEYYEVIK